MLLRSAIKGTVRVSDGEKGLHRVWGILSGFGSQVCKAKVCKGFKILNFGFFSDVQSRVSDLGPEAMQRQSKSKLTG